MGSPSHTRRSGSGVRPSAPIGADAARLRHLVLQQVGPITLAGVGVGLLVLPPSTVTQAARSLFPPGAVENRPGPAHVIAPMLTNINEDGD